MKKNILFRLLSIIFICHTFLVSSQHLVGADISYKHVQGNTFEISLSVYKDCASTIEITNSQTISYFSTSLGTPAKVLNLAFASSGVIKTCDRGISVCDGGTIKSFQKKIFKGRITLDVPASDYKFQWLGFSRTNSLNTFSPSSKGLFVEAMINTILAPSNSSPTFLAEPSFYVFQNTKVEYNPQCLDVSDKDLTHFSLELPMNNVGSNLSFNAGLSATNPLNSSSPFLINSLTGVLSYTPNIEGQIAAIAIKATEKRGNVVVGYAMRDMQVEVLPTIPLPTLSGINGNNFEISVCIGKSVSILVTGRSNTSNVLSISQESTLPESFFSTIPNVGTVTARFIYTPTTTGDHILVLKLRDNNCPIEGITTKTYTIKATELPSISVNVPLLTILTVCNSAINIPISANVSGVEPFSYFWTKDGRNLLNSTANYTATSAGIYLIGAKDALGCVSNKIISYKSKLESDFRVSKNTTCETKPTLFSNRSSLLDLNTKIANYIWDFGDGSPLITTTSSIDQTHIYNVRGIYNVKLSAISEDGCVSTRADSTRIYFAPNAKIVFDANGLFKCEKPGKFQPQASVTGVDDIDLPKISYQWTFTGLSDEVIKPIILEGSAASYLTNSTSVGIKLAVSLVGCGFRDSTIVEPNKKPGFTNVTKNFTPECTFAGFPDYELQANASISGTAMAVSNSLKYEWIGLDGLFTTPGMLPIKLKNKERVYDLTVTDALGCTNDTTITIGDGLKPNFKFAPYYCNSSSIVVAKDSSQFRGTLLNSFVWDFGNGTTIGGFNTTITSPLTIPSGFAPNNTYYIKLILQDKFNCLDTVTVPMMRYDIVNTFDVPKTQLCFNEKIELKSIRSFSKVFDKNNINFWAWNYGNGKKDTLVNHRTYTVAGISPNVVEKTVGTKTKIYGDTVFNSKIAYTVPGIYTITHTIGYNDGGFITNPNTEFNKTTAYGCLANYSQTVTVLSNISYKIDTIQSNYCAGIITTLTSAKLISSLTSNIINYAWTIGQNTSILGTFAGLNGNGTKISFKFSENGNTKFTSNPYYAVLKVTDTNGCIGKDSIPVENLAIPIASIINPPLSCQNQLINFNIDPGASSNAASIENTRWFIEGTDSVFYNNASKTPKFLFNSSANNVHNYSVSFTGIGKFSNCISTAAGVYTTTQAPKTTFSVPANWCNPDILKIEPTMFSFNGNSIESLTNAWTFSDSTLGKNVQHKSAFNVKFNKNETNKITVITTDPATNCTHTATGMVKVYLRPKADFSFASTDAQDAPFVFSTSVINFKDITIIDTSKNVTRSWDFGNGTAYTKNYSQLPLDTNFSYNQSKIFFTKLLVKNTELCKDSVIKKLDLTSFLKMPNAFNPNDDKEINRTFGVLQNGIRKLDFFKIYNRWGQLVFESTDTKTPWNGKVNNNGAEAPTGVYMYMVKATTGYNEVQEYKGQVLLAR